MVIRSLLVKFLGSKKSKKRALTNDKTYSFN